MREFLDGYLFKLTGLPSEDESLRCNILTEHTCLCFGGDNNEATFVISESEDLEVEDGGAVERLDSPRVGYCENDGTAKFVVVESSNDGTCTVASFY